MGMNKMKLAEALIERAELQKANAKLLERVKDNALIQEGDAPAEAPDVLISQYEQNMERFLTLVCKINKTNCQTSFDQDMTIADAIAKRDYLGAKHKAYQNIYGATTITVNRYNQSEIKFVRCIDPREIQTQLDTLAKEYRKPDTQLQGLNWTVDLI
jgi:hypothetical protein